MSTGVIIILAVAVVVIVALVLARPAMRSSGSRLRSRFGPEYERTVARHNGDTKVAEKDLSERLRRHGGLRPQGLSAVAREQYVAQWAGVQEQFVDSPARAVAEADQLLGRLVRDRGYPIDTYDEQVDALSVHHAEHVEGYRRVHTVAALAADGRAGTEELREAVVQARALFEQLVSAGPRDQGRTDAKPRPDGAVRDGGRLHAARAWASDRRRPAAGRGATAVPGGAPDAAPGGVRGPAPGGSPGAVPGQAVPGQSAGPGRGTAPGGAPGAGTVAGPGSGAPTGPGAGARTGTPKGGR